MTATMAVGYDVRRPTMDDVHATFELVLACDLAELGEQDWVEEDVRADMAGADLARDAWLVTDGAGGVVGTALLSFNESGRLFGNVRVHPQHRNRGIGTHLRELLEARARERAAEVKDGVRVSLRAAVYSENAAARRFAERAGYAEVRHFWRMQIDLDREPAAPEWPAGIALRPFDRERDVRAVYEADEEAFADHWGHVRQPYEQWARWTVERGDFDPSLWLIACEGERIAGFALDWQDAEPPRGWVGTLGVLRAYRRRGLGEALLRASFAEFWRRGVRRVVLGVDSQSLTGATRLYERVGMRAVRQWDSFEKELRPGVDLSTRELSQEADA